MQYKIPVIVDYDGMKRIDNMGPFERSLEREFALSVQTKAIEDCENMEQLREVAKNLLEGWSNMQEAVQTLVMENIELRQAMTLRDSELKMAEALMEEAANEIEKQRNSQSSQSSVVFGRGRSEQKDFQPLIMAKLNFRASLITGSLTCRPRI